MIYISSLTSSIIQKFHFLGHFIDEPWESHEQRQHRGSEHEVFTEKVKTAPYPPSMTKVRTGLMTPSGSIGWKVWMFPSWMDDLRKCL